MFRLTQQEKSEVVTNCDHLSVSLRTPQLSLNLPNRLHSLTSSIHFLGGMLSSWETGILPRHPMRPT